MFSSKEFCKITSYLHLSPRYTELCLQVTPAPESEVSLQADHAPLSSLCPQPTTTPGTQQALNKHCEMKRHMDAPQASCKDCHQSISQLYIDSSASYTKADTVLHLILYLLCLSIMTAQNMFCRKKMVIEMQQIRNKASLTLALLHYEKIPFVLSSHLKTFSCFSYCPQLSLSLLAP